MDIVFIDETFDLNQTRNYHISIQAGLNGYSFSVLDPLRNKYILLKHYAFPAGFTAELLEEKIAELNKNDEFLSREYKSSLFSFQSPRYTLIPGPLFSKDNLKDYFEFNHYLEDLDEIHYNTLKSVDAFNVFVIPAEISNLFHRSLGTVRFFNHITPFIERALIHYGGRKAGKTVLANVYGSNADILVIEGDKLLFCNTFPWKTEEDIGFFVLYVFEQMKLGGEDTPLILSGEIGKHHAAYDLLKMYIEKLSFEKRNDHFIYSYTFNDIEQHWFSTLFNLRLCVS